jgi:hypothetical protein
MLWSPSGTSMTNTQRRQARPAGDDRVIAPESAVGIAGLLG